MAAAWQAVCEFDPEREGPLAGFAYCRMMTRCLARYRKEWRYVLHVAASDSREEATTFKHPDFTASSTEKVNGAHPSNDHLRGVVSALPSKQCRLIELIGPQEKLRHDKIKPDPYAKRTARRFAATPAPQSVHAVRQQGALQ